MISPFLALLSIFSVTDCFVNVKIDELLKWNEKIKNEKI